MVELVLRERCEHGFSHPHWKPMYSDWDCPGGRETVLDPERSLGAWCLDVVTIADVLEALKEADRG